MKTTDPTAMSETERFAEITELLGRGAQRLFAAERKALLAQNNAKSCSNHLDVVRTAEASCCSRVQSPQSRTPA